MLEDLKQHVYDANMLLPKRGLVTLTWGNVSAIDRTRGLVVIKPSGVPYEALRPEDMVVVNLSGAVIEGRLRPSTDTPTHLVLYRAYPNIGAVVHTHSTYAVAWAQAGMDIPPLGTTHADHFYHGIPCTRDLTPAEMDAYEEQTGRLITQAFTERGIDVQHTPAVLCRHHGPFAWGADAADAVDCATVLEEVARMAYLTKTLRQDSEPTPRHIQDKHFLRKHGADAYYGQTGGSHS